MIIILFLQQLLLLLLLTITNHNNNSSVTQKRSSSSMKMMIVSSLLLSSSTSLCTCIGIVTRGTLERTTMIRYQSNIINIRFLSSSSVVSSTTMRRMNIQNHLNHRTFVAASSLSTDPTVGKQVHQQTSQEQQQQPLRIAIVGGGLAGLSTAFHFIQKKLIAITNNDNDRFHHRPLHIIILDPYPVGMGGASSVAGGLLHPLSPSGKLVHWGIEGLVSTNQLISAAVKAISDSNTTSSTFSIHETTTENHNDILRDSVQCERNDIIVRNELYRLLIPTSSDNDDDSSDDISSSNSRKEKSSKKIDQQRNEMKSIASLYPEWAEWIDQKQIIERMPFLLKRNNTDSIIKSTSKNIKETITDTENVTSNTTTTTTTVLGGLRLFHSCQVLHVPSYLHGLFVACQNLIQKCNNIHLQKSCHNKVDNNESLSSIEWIQCTISFDDVSLLFQRNVDNDIHNSNDNNHDSTKIMNEEREKHRPLHEYDVIVLAAGSGLFRYHGQQEGEVKEKETMRNNNEKDEDTMRMNHENGEDKICIQNDFINHTLTNPILNKDVLPIQLVNGQSLELNIVDPIASSLNLRQNDDDSFPALLSGKYITPYHSFKDNNNKDSKTTSLLIGATHEYSDVKEQNEETIECIIKKNTYHMIPNLWDNPQSYHIQRITSGIRVQSQRGKYGRRPIIGRLHYDMIQDNHRSHDNVDRVQGEERNHETMMMNLQQQRENSVTTTNKKRTTTIMTRPNVWLYTGLSSRGLLYHSLYADILTDAIIENSEDVIQLRDNDLLWWKKTNNKNGSKNIQNKTRKRS